MKVNTPKSEVLMLLRGTKSEEARKRFVCVRGGEDHLRIPGKKGNTYFAIKPEIQYLGVKLSYGSFEVQSAKFQRNMAKAAFGQLRAVLRTGACLSKAERVRIYRSCVWTVLEHGLIGVGFDRRAIDLICTTTAVHLRKILSVHEKGVSNKQLFYSAGIDPVQLLLQRVEDKLDWIPAGAGDMLQAGRTRLHRIRDNLRAIIEAGECTLTVHTAESTVSCPVCGLYFANESGLAMHIKSKHHEIHDAARVEYVKSKHAINGLPQCFFCQKMLCDNHSLEKHITMGGCMVISGQGTVSC